MKKIVLGLMSLWFFTSVFVTSVSAITVINGTLDDGDVVNVTSVAAWSTTGNTMEGMRVTAYYSDGGSQAVDWSGGASGTGWSLGLTNGYDTSTFYDTQWLFDVSEAGVEISSFKIEALGSDYLGNTVFDIFNDPDTSYDEKTPGSEQGIFVDVGTYDRSWEVGSTYVGNIKATYSGRVTYQGSDAYGDLYHTLTIDFLNGGFDKEDVLAFYADTDNLVNPVPEPATVVLFGAGLLLLASGRRMTRKK